MTTLMTDDAEIAAGLAHYLRQKTFTYPQLAQNLKSKLADRDFAGDLSSLTVSAPDAYAHEAAAGLVMERLGSRLRNAPKLADIANGAWCA